MSSTAVQPTEWLQELQARSFHVTPTKEALLVLLTRAAFPLSAEKAWGLCALSVRTRGAPPSTACSIRWRKSAFFVAFRGCNCNPYVLAQDSEHPLFVCISCGKADDALQFQLEALTQQRGYRLHATHIQLLGMCSVCQTSL